MYLATAGALKAAADRAIGNAPHVNEAIDRAAGDQHAAGTGNMDMGSMPSGVKDGIKANSQNNAEGEQQKKIYRANL